MNISEIEELIEQGKDVRILPDGTVVIGEPLVLMGADNHDGWKLEELCKQLQKELLLKSPKIVTDDKREAYHVFNNNEKIIHLLQTIIDTQMDSMDMLEKIGENKGPGGVPRIGEGSKDS